MSTEHNKQSSVDLRITRYATLYSGLDCCDTCHFLTTFGDYRCAFAEWDWAWLHAPSACSTMRALRSVGTVLACSFMRVVWEFSVIQH